MYLMTKSLKPLLRALNCDRNNFALKRYFFCKNCFCMAFCAKRISLRSEILATKLFCVESRQFLSGKINFKFLSFQIWYSLKFYEDLKPMVLNPEDDDNGNDKNHKSLYYEVLYFVGMTNIASLILPLKNIIVTKISP